VRYIDGICVYLQIVQSFVKVQKLSVKNVREYNPPKCFLRSSQNLYIIEFLKIPICLIQA